MWTLGTKSALLQEQYVLYAVLFTAGPSSPALVFLFLFVEMISLSSLGWAGTCYVDQSGLPLPPVC